MTSLRLLTLSLSLTPDPTPTRPRLDDVLEVALEHPVQLEGLPRRGAQVAVAPPDK